MERVRLTKKPRRNLGGKTRGRKPGVPQLDKSKYKSEFAKMARILAEQGATDDILADAFSVSTSAIKGWYSAHPEFGTAVREGKNAVFDPKVERSLAQRALGYTVDTEEVKILANGAIIRYPVRKHFPPDTTACIFWLKNRNPEKWRDVQDYRHTGKVDVANLTAAQLLDEIRKEAAELGITDIVAQLPIGVAPKGSNGKTTH